MFILSSEGHEGYGIDLRKRGIWDIFPATTILKTQTIVPSDQTLFSDVDWIIGNHSDELSPWIPVISARSSYESRYFLLPCCAFEFNGKKYQRRSGAKSQYIDFLDYVQKINSICGFQTKIDRLKIPSTKRVCLIGMHRLYGMEEQDYRSQLIQQFIDKESGNVDKNSKSSVWNADFVARPEIQKVQNCTRIDKNIRDFIIDLVVRELLSKQRFLPDYYKPDWNAGGKLNIADLAQMIPHDKLLALKSECGGLQTLLRNNGHIFQVVAGTVKIRIPVTWIERKQQLEKKLKNKRKEFTIKRMPCWFFQNHPDGCPLVESDCSYTHIS